MYYNHYHHWNQGQNFYASKSFKSFVGTTVQMNSKIKGTLHAIKSDYCVIESNDGVAYYPMHHVKGFTQVVEDEQDNNSQTSENDEQDQSQEEKEEAIIVPGKRFVDVLDRLKGESCQINQGPHKIKGTVMGRAGDHLMMEVNNEVLYIPLFHVQSFSWNYNNNNNNNNNNDNNNNNGDNAKNEQKSSGNKQSSKNK
ncbi:hypothetical protein [Bacillus sp. 165]|uniref:hypothetical protein n=1 Tax=Bacillus sp. 165 TaxID=1529117 RepID=UPI001ADB908A|nr:hypothetical protein [Bacillus sp. 165]MBO9128317.1 hypothetical protein [Bacillus sp. 165]